MWLALWSIVAHQYMALMTGVQKYILPLHSFLDSSDKWVCLKCIQCVWLFLTSPKTICNYGFVMLLLSGSTNIFLKNLYSVSGPTNLVYVVGTWKQMPHCVWMVDLGVGAADPICVAAWASCQGRDACAWAFRRQKFCFVFRFFFSLHLSGTDWENSKLMHTEPSSFLALSA